MALIWKKGRKIRATYRCNVWTLFETCRFLGMWTKTKGIDVFYLFNWNRIRRHGKNNIFNRKTCRLLWPGETNGFIGRMSRESDNRHKEFEWDNNKNRKKYTSNPRLAGPWRTKRACAGASLWPVSNIRSVPSISLPPPPLSLWRHDTKSNAYIVGTRPKKCYFFKIMFRLR